MHPKIWLSFCLVFLIYNLKLLIDDYEITNYMIVDKTDKLYYHSTRLLLCIRFQDIQENNKLIIETSTNQNVSASIFLNYTIQSIEFNLNTSNLFKLNQSFILNNFVCFLIDKKELEVERPLNGMLSYYEYNYLFPDPELEHPILSNYINQKGDLNLHIYNLKIKRQKIYNLNYLKNPNCLNEKLSDRINCINKCLDSIDSLYGFYNYLDNRKFNLKLISNHSKREINTIQFSNDSKIYLDKNKYDQLKTCYNNCPNNSCHYDLYNGKQLIANEYKSFDDKIIDIKSSIYLAYYLIDDFWIQLIGLICLITGSCLINLLLSFWNFVFNENRREYLRILIYYHQKYFQFITFKSIFLSIFLLIISIQSLIMFKDYDYKSRFPNRTSYIYYSTELPSIIICLPIQLLKFDDFNINFDRDFKTLKNNTYNDIKKTTNFNESRFIEKIQFVYGNKIRSSLNNKFKWIINDNETYFKGSKLESFNHNYLTRCFRIELNYTNNLRYEYLNPIHYLEIGFKTSFWNLFLIDKNQKFIFNLTELKEGNSFRKIAIFKKANCNNLNNDKMIKINRCLNEKFIKKFNSLSLYSLVDENELIRLNLSFHNLKFNFNKTNFNEIEAECLNEYDHLIDCNQIKYEETFKITESFDYWTIRINLNHETYYEYEFEQSLIKLFLSILDLISISLGITVIGLLSSISKLIKLKFTKIIIIIICLIGFSVHNLLIFKGVVDDKLLHSLYFEKLNNYKLPNILICIDLQKDIKIDENFRLTSNYLNKNTDKVNLDKIFHRIVYFNKTHMNGFIPSNDNRFNDEISIDTLYFLNFKCFEFKLNVEINVDDLFVVHSKHSLGFYFNKIFIGNSKLIYILYRHSNSNQFSDLLKYEIQFDKYRKSIHKYTSSTIIFELIEIEKEDHFESLKNPIGLLYGKVNLDDTTTYLNNMRDKFKQLTNLTTREILLENDNFNLEIDEDLFKQYYLQVQNYTDHNHPVSSNIKQNYYDCETKHQFYKIPFIGFSKLSKIKKILITNQDNNAKLLLNLLNALSLWLDICILDLYKYFHLSFNPFKFTIIFYRYLIEFKIKFKNVSSSIELM